MIFFKLRKENKRLKNALCKLQTENEHLNYLVGLRATRHYEVTINGKIKIQVDSPETDSTKFASDIAKQLRSVDIYSSEKEFIPYLYLSNTVIRNDNIKSVQVKEL